MQSYLATNTDLGPSSFFRGRLLTAEPEEISTMVDRMDQEVKDIKQQSLKMAWYMRGGATYEDVLQMSFQERDLVSALIKDNLETTKSSKLPFF